MKRQIIINGKETKVRLISLLIRHGALCGDIPHQVEDFKSNTKKELLVMVKRFNIDIEQGGNGNINPYYENDNKNHYYYILQDYMLNNAILLGIPVKVDRFDLPSELHRKVEDICRPVWENFVKNDCLGIIGKADIEGGKLLINNLLKQIQSLLTN